MTARNTFETVLGGVVLCTALFFLVLAYTSIDFGPRDDTYRLSARFEDIGGLATNSPVRIGGIAVGQVVGFRLDPETYDAIVDLAISQEIQLPADTSASISQEGLLGGLYIRLEIGGGDGTLEPGGEITYTTSALDIRGLLNIVAGGRSGGG